MEPTSDQIALLQATSDESTDTVIPDPHDTNILDSPPHMEELDQTHAPLEAPDLHVSFILESKEASVPHVDQNLDTESQMVVDIIVGPKNENS